MDTASISVPSRRPARVVAGGAVGLILGIWVSGAAGPATAAVVAAFIAGAVAVGVAWVDAREHRIPDAATLPGLAFLGLYWVGGTFAARAPELLLGAVLGGTSAFVIGWLMARFGPLGFGDVKLMAVLGLGFGAQGMTAVVAVFVSTLLAAFVYALFLLVTRRAKMSTYIPLGPAFAIGAGVGCIASITS